ncbi:hypothetical protein [Pseudidiomarina homiensis]|uniref:NERD domain-containing protein n=1 Tax=Pseudidiomarina homiensis TaxID=364198 RepID=A0A432XY18_9GAMM|nr:hypothetical protein [Pseudidiomarina homiensis]RUO53471.1 hypothetical protein CWI70_09815 [Pseudidiomarina homiensis]
MTLEDPHLLNAFDKLCHDYKANMMRFRPCKPGGEMLEANLVFSFIMAFKELYPDAFWAVEVPFESTETNSHNNHLDALIFIDGTLYLIEAKRDYATQDQLNLMRDDLARIESPRLATSLQKMIHRDVYDNPLSEVDKVIGVLLADTWQNSNRNAWRSGVYNGETQDWLPKHRTMSDLGIYAQGARTPYTLMAAHTDNLTQSLETIRGIRGKNVEH